MTPQTESTYPTGVNLLDTAIDDQIKRLTEMNFVERFNQRDVTLWTEDKAEKDEVAHRLGWLDAVENGAQIVRDAGQLLQEVLSEGFTHAVVLGMGGSSLAPEVYSEFITTHGEEQKDFLVLTILDSTSPTQILDLQKKIPLDKTLFIVSSKSGTTVEMKTLMAYFWEQVSQVVGEDVGKHFVAISDPGTKLQKMAADKGFRKAFEADPNVGGRYSALIAFGLVPAVLAGYDGEKLLESSLKLSKMPLSMEDPGVKLGVVLGAAYANGRDKLTLLADAPVEPIGAWIEQLVAESSGKDGKGILPIDQEPLMPMEDYGSDRLFVYLRADGQFDERASNLTAAKLPVFNCRMPELYDLAAEYYRWEIAIATVSVLLGINAFNQPNVQESKDIATQMLNTLKAGDELEIGQPMWQDDTLALYGDLKRDHGNVQAFLKDFLQQAQAGDYIALNAFIERNEENELRLDDLRRDLTRATHLPTTMGFGPRFLHSTGQLHKGGKNNGLYIVISQDEAQEVDVPGEGIRFNDLIFAQALGDTQALKKHQRRVIRLHFSKGSFKQHELTDLFRL
ncbi:MAG: transaldolase / glucose-6-phosphate isomerase [Chloroflexota bacterium]|nr:transaldolase / glucose-6-phosphate isomerase [Chloroflexota bacterium]